MSSYTVPAIVFGCCSCVCFALNLLQAMADVNRPNRKGLGQIQSFFHRWLTFGALLLAASCFAAAISLYDFPIVLANILFEQCVLCAINCALLLVYLQCVNASETSRQETSTLTGPILVVASGLCYVADALGITLSLVYDQVAFKSIFDLAVTLVFTTIPIVVSSVSFLRQ